MMYPESDQQTATRNNNFMHHAPHNEEQVTRYESNRNSCQELARMFNVHCPPSRELSLAHTKLEEAMFWANAAIARNEKPEEENAVAGKIGR